MTTKLIAADVSAGAILDPSVGDGTLVIQTGAAGAKVDAISLAADGTPTFLKVPKNAAVQSMVRLNTANGYGSTNTGVRRFTNVVTNQGSDITYADSATLGATFTINTSGVYTISYTDAFTAANDLAITRNATVLTGLPSTLSEVLFEATIAGGAATRNGCSGSAYLAAGDVIRAQAGGTTSGSRQFFTITRVA